ncbi:hypothetical protein ACHAW5_009781 [Stephanodiscus triporus]|uniref:Uncharacterized protein n=1 Tax=Stephanodiscus triporus TaxID=2934178 RepID=A0ABD3NXR4_9STRA
MFPYKIRKPAWGSLKPKEAKCGGDKSPNGAVLDASSLLLVGGDPDDPHTVGGNLQRAILSDLIELRMRYHRSLARREVSGPSHPPDATAAPATSTRIRRLRGPVRGDGVATDDYGGETTSATRSSYDHVARGSSFGVFKACFRESRFGAMHTRTIPPRVDRGEYVQLLYSSCLHLLEESFKHSRVNSDPSRRDDNMRPYCGLDAIYSVFVLYALHRTNVLPKAPSRRSHVERTQSGKFDERSLKEAWSMLPIGINSDEDKLYRRTFLSPVRIDRWNYILLLRLRDACLAQVEQCGVDAMAGCTMMTNADTAAWNGECEDSCRRCYCGPARDAAHIIDTMLFDDSFFDYCEYHGPHGLEGLCGSPNFYRANFASTSKKKTNGPKNNIKAVTITDPLAMTKFELNTIGTDDGILDSLDLQKLSTMVDIHCSNLSSVMTNLRMSRSNDFNLQPKQMEQVLDTLSGIVNSPTYAELVDKLNAEEAPRSNSSNLSGAIISEAMPPPEVQPLFLKFPENFSPCCEIDFMDDAIMIREAVVKENRVRLKGESMPELDRLDCLISIATQRDEMSIDNNPPPPTAVQRRKKRRSDHDKFFELQQEGTRDDGTSNNTSDEVSIATGPGKNALISLLSISKGNESGDDISTDIFAQEDDSSIATGAGQNALLSLLSMAGGAYDSDQLEDESSPSEDDESQSLASSVNHAAPLALNDDSASVTSGIGKRALHFLLTGQADNRQSQTVKNRAIKKASHRKFRQKSVKTPILPPLPAVKATQRKAISKRRIDDGFFPKGYSEDASSDDEATDYAGRNALATLLSNTESVEV